MTKVTIMTPTYNRGRLIGQLYRSLVAQTDDDFEWLVIDDGSSDDTAEVIKGFIANDNSFEIHYLKQTNGGKHRAVNRGVKVAQGEYCLIVDSDDYLDKQAISKIKQWIESITNLDNFAGVAGLKADFSQKTVGQAPVSTYVDCTNLERKKYNLLGDKAEVYRTDILRQYPFPEFVGEKFLSEAVVWNGIAEDGYKLRWFNEVIYYCEYRQDGLTNNIGMRHKSSPKGFALYINQLADSESNPFKKAWLYGLYVRDVYDYQYLGQAAADLGRSLLAIALGVLMRRLLGR